MVPKRTTICQFEKDVLEFLLLAGLLAVFHALTVLNDIDDARMIDGGQSVNFVLNAMIKS